MGRQTELLRNSPPDVVDIDRPIRPPSELFVRYPQRLADAAEETLAETLLRIVRNRKWTIIAFTLAVMAIVAAASLLMNPQYDALGRVVFYRENGDGFLGFKGVDTSLASDPDDSSTLDTQIGILKTNALAAQVISDLHLDQNPAFTRASKKPITEDGLIASFHKDLDISKEKGTRLIEIRYRSGDPQLAANIVNDLAKAYVEQNYKSKFQATKDISGFLAKQLTELQAKVETSQQALVDYQKEHGILGLDEKQNIVTAKLDDLNKALTAAETDRIQKEADYRLSRSDRPDLIAKLEPDSLITKLRGQEADLQVQLAQASVQLGPAHPKVLELSRQLERVRQSITAETARIGERIRDEYRATSNREHLLRQALESQKQAADEMNASAIQFDILRRDFEANRKLYDDLLQKLKEAGITASLKSSNIRIVDPAKAPMLPVEPNIPRNMALALMFGGLGGIFLAFSLSKLDDRLSTPQQVSIISPLPSLGVVPLLPRKRSNGSGSQLPQRGNGHLKLSAPVSRISVPELVSFTDPSSPAAESYKGLLTSILLSSPVPPAVILITSALPGEGKTTVSMNFGFALARERRRVLLIDADLRRPGIHLPTRLKSETGLSALLRDEVPFEQAVVPCPEAPGLSILPAGPVRLPEDAELLAARFKELLLDWRGRFDHILIDTPPVLLFTDAVRMSVEADSVVLVVRSGQTEKSALLSAQELLFNVQARLTGIILNGADLNSPDFKNGYRYGYYGAERTESRGRGEAA
jgi:polysaccharide biosynthesis transport protein